jgi:exosome complex exonuclease DIS3/RRP44
MRRSKAFVRKTRKGKVLTVTREHYLRDDIFCGSSLCRECGKDPKLVPTPLPII